MLIRQYEEDNLHTGDIWHSWEQVGRLERRGDLIRWADAKSSGKQATIGMHHQGLGCANRRLQQ